MEKRIIEVEVNDLAFDGKAVGHLEGKVIFLKGGLPGELVRAEIFRSKARYEEGIVREILRKSPERTPAPCEHFGYCGGCTWQDLNYPAQLGFKEKQVRDCIERIGKLTDTSVGPIRGAESIFHYRNKMEFSFHVTDDENFTLGLHARGRFDDIFDVNFCHLQSPRANNILQWVRNFVREKQIPIYDVRQHHGFMRFLVLREARQTRQIMLNLVTNYGDLPHQLELIDGVTAAFPEIATIVHNQNGQKSNIATGEIETVLYGPGYIEEQVLGMTFRIRANSFFQTNSQQAERLYSTAFELLEPKPEDELVDLYCGTGTIGILASRNVKSVVGVELVAAAVQAARENADINRVENISFVEGDVTAYLKQYPAEEASRLTFIIDPPRAGMHPKALKRLIELKPTNILYISCNPATFARDAHDLDQAGYHLPRVIPVDMFPHTMHIELVGRFALL